MWAQAFLIVRMNILVFLVLALLLEGAGQVVALVRPSYEVLFLQPDRDVGWTQVPNLRWTWAGHGWYAADFSVNVHTNALGFRDAPREVVRAPGVRRVALLGDSLIEAVQVPLGKTAGQLLEQRLNTLPARGGELSQKWEVLNFGISNYGVGQYLLVWERYAGAFDPDYVAILVAGFHMRRTVTRYESGAFPATRQRRLWIRPTFRVEHGDLIREPARDYDAFVEAQRTRIEDEFGGRRTRRRKRLVTVHYARHYAQRLHARSYSVRRAWRRLEQLVPRSAPPVGPAAPPTGLDRESDAQVLAVNLKIIEELRRGVAGAGGRLVVLDASRYFGDDAAMSRALEEFCVDRGIGYVPLYAALMRANAQGVSTRWVHDAHFNEAGNAILADALLAWVAQNPPARRAR